jgi:hypothetical protein
MLGARFKPSSSEHQNLGIQPIPCSISQLKKEFGKQNKIGIPLGGGGAGKQDFFRDQRRKNIKK